MADVRQKYHVVGVDMKHERINLVDAKFKNNKKNSYKSIKHMP